MSLLSLLVCAVSALAHLLVQEDLNELLRQLNCCRNLGEHFKKVALKLYLLEGIVVLLNLIGMRHADQEFSCHRVVVCNEVSQLVG